MAICLATAQAGRQHSGFQVATKTDLIEIDKSEDVQF